MAFCVHITLLYQNKLYIKLVQTIMDTYIIIVEIDQGRSVSRLPRIVRSPSKSYRSTILTTSTPKCDATLDDSGKYSNVDIIVTLDQ